MSVVDLSDALDDEPEAQPDLEDRTRDQRIRLMWIPKTAASAEAATAPTRPAPCRLTISSLCASAPEGAIQKAHLREAAGRRLLRSRHRRPGRPAKGIVKPARTSGKQRGRRTAAKIQRTDPGARARISLPITPGDGIGTTDMDRSGGVPVMQGPCDAECQSQGLTTLG